MDIQPDPLDQNTIPNSKPIDSNAQAPVPEPQKDKSLLDAMAPGEKDSFDQTPNPPPAAQNPPPQSSNFAQPVPVQFQTKKGIPKVVLILIAVFLLLIVATLIMVFTRRSKPITLVGTKGELTWWGIENDERVIQPMIDEYEKKNPNIKITYVNQSVQDYRERLTNSLAQGKGPDIFEIHDSWVPMFRSELSSLPSNVMSSEEYKNTFYPVAQSDFSNKTGIYAIPLEYDALTLFYNKDIFDSAAVQPPVTWDEVSTISTQLTQKTDKTILQAGIALGISQNVDYWPDILGLMVIQNGSDPAKPTVKAWDAMGYFGSFTSELGVWDSSLPNSVSAFAKNKLAMLFAPTSATKDIVLENSNLRFSAAPVPQLPKNNPTDPDYTYATYWAESVWLRSRNADVAWDFLKFLSTKESLVKMNQLRVQNNILEKAYPRRDMAYLQKDNKILNSILVLAEKAKGWYLHDKTNDGETGINSQINKVYSQTLSDVIGGKDSKKLIDPWVANINAVLIKYSPKK